MAADKKPKVEEEVGEASYAFNWDDPVEKLQEVQEQLDKINRDVFKKVLEIETKYNVMRKPIYEERTEIIRKIPYFWKTTLLNHPMIGELITDNDNKILMHMDSLIVQEFEDLSKGYCISFNFKANPYFENKQLTKTIKFLNDGTTTATGTIIVWKEGQGPADKSGNVADGHVGEKRALANNESFFNWFSDPRAEESKVEQDEVAESIVEDIWPNPVKMFMNQGEETDDNSDEDDDEEEEEGDTDDDFEFKFY